MGENYSSDNSGNRVPPVPQMVNPVAASGITLSMAVSGTDYEQELVGGEMYAITFLSSTVTHRMFASATGVTSTAANIEWVFMANIEYIFRMPLGKDILFCESDGTTAFAYIRKLAK